MAYTTTRAERADRSQTMRAILAVVAVATFGVLSVPAVAQVKAPTKTHLKTHAKANAPSPTDNQADKLNEQWLKEHSNGATASVPADASPSGKGAGEDERTSSVPSMAALPGAGARTIVSGSVKLVSAKVAAAGFLPGAPHHSALKPLSQAFAGFSTSGAPKVEMLEGRTGDGSSRLLYASIGEGKSKKSYWWFTPLDQPEGWFDESGRRVGGTMLSDPKPDSRISSPFGTRRYYGRSTGHGFHNGIDYEGKIGEPIHAAADGVINHQNWYYQYGRTVKITHADNFETLYAHMSRFETSLAVGSHVKKGDIIGYVGSTGRSTGPHLHFSVIVHGQFVDPQPYVSEGGGHGTLDGQSLVAYRKWQQDVRSASDTQRSKPRSEPWSHNPFTGHN
jgi:murein DD-endopeptidase MepM/ murein hydrolase activator NlpD